MRLDQLTFTRFFGCLFVVIFHYGKDIFPFYDSIISKIAPVGLSYFFILSGFIMMQAYYKTENVRIDPKRYYLNRFARIYPIYFIALIATFILITVKYGKFQLIELFLSLFCLQTWVPTYPNCLNYPGWSISVELLFYALFPFLANVVYRKLSTKGLIYLAVGFWFITTLVVSIIVYTPLYKGFPSISHDILFYQPIMHLNEFIAGNIFGLFFINQGKRRVQRNYDLLIIAICLGVYLLVKFPVPYVNYFDGFLAILYLPFIYFLSLNNGLITKVFNNKYLLFLGETSYGVYILQRPLHGYFVALFNKLGVSDPVLLFYSFFIALIVISCISYKYVETPLRRRIQKFQFKYKTKEIAEVAS